MTFNNELIQYAVYSKRDRFIHQLQRRQNEILRLASSQCNKGPCAFFTPNALGKYVIHGSYNLSFFIRFSDGVRCVFRVPLRPCLATSAQEKLRSEIVTMKYISKNTTIPLPKILARRLEDGTDPLSTFIILEFIDGTQLLPRDLASLPRQKRHNLFTSLADIYVQLRRQEFAAIGRLDGSADEPYVGQKTSTIDMNMLQLEGLEAFSIRDSFHDEQGILQSATSYTKMLLCIGYNALLKSPNAVTKELGVQAIHNHELFIHHTEHWMDTGRDKGPFVLAHGDLHLSNLVLDDDGRIVGVLDWEWSGVVPVQYFTPPLWLTGRDTVQLALPSSWELFLKTACKEFLAIIEAREMEMFGNHLLHSEWSQSVDMAEPLVANALLNSTDVEWFVHRYINHKQQLSDDEQAVWRKANPSLALLAYIKEHDHHRYRQALDHLNTDDPTKLQEAGIWTPMEMLCMVPKHTLVATNILGWSVAVCVVLASIWKRL